MAPRRISAIIHGVALAATSVAIGLGAGSGRAPGAHRGGEVRVSSAYEVHADERVFAYGRVSPGGELLAYTSEPARGSGTANAVSRLLKVVRLRDDRLLFSAPGADGFWSP